MGYRLSRRRRHPDLRGPFPGFNGRQEARDVRPRPGRPVRPRPDRPRRRAGVARFVEFFAADIRNPNTRAAYGKAAASFFSWCQTQRLELEDIQPVHVAAYVELLQQTLSAPSVKQQLSAIRRLLDYLVVGQVLPTNPATPVRGPKLKVGSGKTPVLTAKEARQLLDSIQTSTLVGLRDRAIIAVMMYSFARVGAVTKLRVKDFYTQGTKATFRLHEKGGTYLQVPAHHKAREYVDAYLEAAGIRDDERGPLFRAAYKKTGKLLEQGLSTTAVLKIMQRRAKAAAFPKEICCHTCRATGHHSLPRGRGRHRDGAVPRGPRRPADDKALRSTAGEGDPGGDRTHQDLDGATRHRLGRVPHLLSLFGRADYLATPSCSCRNRIVALMAARDCSSASMTSKA